MLFYRCYDICHESGAVLIPDFECIIEASLEWDCGQPVASIDDIFADCWVTKKRVSLLYDPDAVFAGLAHRLLEAIEADESILIDLVEDYGDFRQAMLADMAEAERDRRAGL